MDGMPTSGPYGLPSSALDPLLDGRHPVYHHVLEECLTARPVCSSEHTAQQINAEGTPLSCANTPSRCEDSTKEDPQAEFFSLPKAYSLHTIAELQRDPVYSWAVQPATYDGGNQILGCFKEPDPRVINKVMKSSQIKPFVDGKKAGQHSLTIVFWPRWDGTGLCNA
jgi:hypothetical protein